MNQSDAKVGDKIVCVSKKYTHSLNLKYLIVGDTYTVSDKISRNIFKLEEVDAINSNGCYFSVHDFELQVLLSTIKESDEDAYDRSMRGI